MSKKGSNPPPPRPPANGEVGIGNESLNEGLNVNPQPPTNVRPSPPPPPPPPKKKEG